MSATVHPFPWEAAPATRCTHRRGSLVCALDYDHEYGHVFIIGAPWLPERDRRTS